MDRRNNRMDLLPSDIVLGALLAACLLPLLLVVLAHGPWRERRPGRRFFLAAGLDLGLWVVWIALQPAWHLADLAAGGLILLTAFLVGFTIWTLIAWGFTLTMLRAIADAGEPISEEEWVVQYTGGQTLEAFGKDRLFLLLKSRLGRLEEDRVLSTAKGRFGARVGLLLRRLLAIKA